ncbi:MAG: ABC transporter substrate-binding protein [Alphaproteobacteria bacterium]
MKNLEIDLGCGDYDLLRPLRDGKVRAEGMEINFVPIEKPPEVHWRMGIHGEFDAAEMSLGTYVAGKARGDFPFVAVPAFVYRKFRHSAAYINTDSGITRPEDLAGKKIGVPEWQMTATVWLRGILQDDHGVAVTNVKWFTGGLETWGRKEKIPLQLPREINVESIPEGENLSAMLVARKIDALLTAQVPGPYVKRMPQIQRLFSNPRRAEEDYFRRTGIFPIMHVMVIREELYRHHRWVAQSLFKALLEAKAVCIDSAVKNDCIQSILPWAGNDLEETRELMGEDFWPYGVEPNRKTIETFLRYASEQGLTPRPLKIEDLFIKETLDTFRV